MTDDARSVSEALDDSKVIPRPLRATRQLSPLLCGSAVGLFVVGVGSGWGVYLHRSQVRAAHVAGTAAWPAHIALAVLACVAYLVAWRRHRRRFGPRSGRPLLLAPLSRNAAERLIATLRLMSWRTVGSKPPLIAIVYCFWRAGEQVTAGLDPNYTVNAWGGPTYLGALACHFLDLALVIAACAWLAWFLLARVTEDR